MTRFNEWLIRYHNDAAVVDFLKFVHNELTTTQCKEVLRIDDAEEFIQYLLCAFGCYCIPRKMGVPHLIRNPEALSLTPEQRKELVELLKTTIINELETTKAAKAIKSQKK